MQVPREGYFVLDGLVEQVKESLLSQVPSLVLIVVIAVGSIAGVAAQMR